MAAATDLLAQVPPEVLDRIAKLVPDKVALLAAASGSQRAQSGAAVPKWRRLFHVFLDTYPQASGSERRESMLAALEAQATRFSLLSITMPDFVLDADDNPFIHPPMLAPERGAVRLAAVLRRCPELETLDVARTRIDRWREIGLALRFCPRLLRLDLSGQNMYVRNNPFGGLSRCRALTELRLADCEIYLVAAQLGQALAQCTALRLLDLRKNMLSGEDARLQPPVSYMSLLLAGLRQHPSLEHLDLSACQLDVHCMHLLGGALPTWARLEHLDLSSNGLNNTSLLPIALALPQCPAMRHLRLRGNSAFRPRALFYLGTQGGMRGLASLDLSRCAIDCSRHVQHNGAEFVAELARCQRLRALNLSENELGDTFARALARVLPECAALESLDLAETQMSDAGVRALAAGVRLCPWLERLNVRGNALSEEARGELQRAWSAVHATTMGLEM